MNKLVKSAFAITLMSSLVWISPKSAKAEEEVKTELNYGAGVAYCLGAGIPAAILVSAVAERVFKGNGMAITGGLYAGGILGCGAGAVIGANAHRVPVKNANGNPEVSSNTDKSAAADQIGSTASAGGTSSDAMILE